MWTRLRSGARRVPGRRTERRAQVVAVNLFVFVLLPFVPALGVHGQDAPSEYQVKAAYLFNFPKFVEWPEDAFGDPLAPLVIGVLGEDPFGNALPQVVLGKTVQGRDIVIHIYRAGEDLRGAHILFISASEKKRLPAILSSLRGSSVLTVADLEGFLDAGGMIQFVPENSRVRFAVNVDAARRGRLKMSSKLLSLAKAVEGNDKDFAN